MSGLFSSHGSRTGVSFVFDTDSLSLELKCGHNMDALTGTWSIDSPGSSIAGRVVACKFLSSRTLRSSLPFAFSMSPGQDTIYLFFWVWHEGQLVRLSATNSRTIFALAQLNRWRMSNDHCQIDVLAINFEIKQARRAWLRSDSSFLQHRSVCPGLNSELSPFAPLVNARKSCCSRVTLPFDARFLHSYHVASVQTHVCVKLIEGAVCADSVLVTA